MIRLNRRKLLTGAVALAAYSRMTEAQAAFQYTGAAVDLYPATAQYFPLAASNFLSEARVGSNATDLLPTSASGASYNTFAANTLRLTSGLGWLIEEPRINYLLNSTVPATQTTQSLATGTYTLWVNGSGTATPSGGTATITGAAAASNGSPNTFVVTVTGTVVVTVSGSLNAFQLELGGAANVYAGSSLIVTGGTIGMRPGDNVALINTAFYVVQSGSFSVVMTVQRLTTAVGTLLAGNDPGSISMQDHNSSAFINAVNKQVLATSSTVLSVGSALACGMNFVPGAEAVKVHAGTLATGTAPTVQIPDTSYNLGSSAGASYLNGYVARIGLFPTPLSNTALGALI